MDVIVANVSEGHVYDGKLEGVIVLQEVSVCLVCHGVLSNRNAVVGRRLGCLLDV